MNSISAINSYLSPELRAAALSKAGDSTAPATIPGAELQGLGSGDGSAAQPLGGEGSFGSFLGQLVGEVSAKQSAAGAAANGLMTGQNVSLHQTMIATEEANVSFQLMVEVRNRLLESYQELMRMQV
jgi:flagellar hook-basal body complex protein FliE